MLINILLKKGKKKKYIKKRGIHLTSLSTKRSSTKTRIVNTEQIHTPSSPCKAQHDKCSFEPQSTYQIRHSFRRGVKYWKLKTRISTTIQKHLDQHNSALESKLEDDDDGRLGIQAEAWLPERKTSNLINTLLNNFENVPINQRQARAYLFEIWCLNRPPTRTRFTYQQPLRQFTARISSPFESNGPRTPWTKS